ncbi:DUF305 domain-containing protein [Pseudonocardia sp. RS010]|uniref:DUF305 domain-containing protein n=1 Tax=Pseudonocardia sp. RS010 TaxID=3385979 RepID=UPI0039A26A60
MYRKPLLGIATAAAAAALLAGCGGTQPASTAAPSTTAAAPSSAAVSAEHNDADVSFAQGMIVHHTQAIDMAKLATDRANNEQVKQLATKIEQAQGPEIDQMRGFLAAWGEPETGDAGMSGSMPGMNHGGSAMPSMPNMSGGMTDAQMQQLGQASGTDFDRLFLQMMTEHHNGAIQMAQTELTSGQNTEAKALAQKIITDQQAEIGEMQNLLSSL